MEEKVRVFKVIEGGYYRRDEKSCIHYLEDTPSAYDSPVTLKLVMEQTDDDDEAQLYAWLCGEDDGGYDWLIDDMDDLVDALRAASKLYVSFTQLDMLQRKHGKLWDKYFLRECLKELH